MCIFVLQRETEAAPRTANQVPVDSHNFCPSLSNEIIVSCIIL